MSNRNFFTLIFLAIIVYLFNLRLDVMQVDAAQYAVMSWEMLITHGFLKLHCLGADYLDKPPLIFWLSSLSFSLLGFNNIAYKLPSFLFALLSIFSTYRLAKMYYNEKTARIAAVMLASTQALFLITNDVRTDTLLMGSVAFSIWQWAEFFEEGKTVNLLAGSLALALALLAKGPIGLVAAGAALFPHIIVQGTWKKLFDLRMVLGIFIIAVLLMPMCIGLYQQYGFKGLKFYFWTQSFGRVTGSSEWNNHPDTFFLLHTTAWAFLPWSLFLLLGWVRSIVYVVRKKFQLSWNEEIISVSGFTLVLIMLSLSKYQLPHYIFVVYPLAAIMAARGFLQLATWPKARPWLTALQATAMIALIPVSMLFQYLLMGGNLVSIISIVVFFPLAVWMAVKMEGGIKTPGVIITYVSYRFKRFYHAIFGGRSEWQLTIAFGLDVIYRKLFFISALMYIVFNFLLSAFYFPAILKYQPQCDFGRYINAHQSNSNFVCYHAVPDFAMVFYAQQQPPFISDPQTFKTELNKKKNMLVIASPAGVQALNDDHVVYSIIEQRDMYLVAQLRPGFLNPKTRSSVCDKLFLLEVKAQ